VTRLSSVRNDVLKLLIGEATHSDGKPEKKLYHELCISVNYTTDILDCHCQWFYEHESISQCSNAAAADTFV